MATRLSLSLSLSLSLALPNPTASENETKVFGRVENRPDPAPEARPRDVEVPGSRAWRAEDFERKNVLAGWGST